MGVKPSIAAIINEADSKGCQIWQVVLEREAHSQGVDTDQVWDRMAQLWEVMKDSLTAGFKPGLTSVSGLVGKEGYLMKQYVTEGKALSGNTVAAASARAMGVAVVNASMGRIVAAPTAGSCGILPAVIMTAAEKCNAGQEEIIGALFTAAGIGAVIDENATTSGAQGGCQAECGAAACMAAVAATELAGGTPGQAANAGAIALKNVIGLACDPVAGLVEVPCVKRNAFGAANALLAADMALAGITSAIPIDEVIDAMREVGDLMPNSLKETAQAGLANTPTAREIAKKISPQDN